MSYLKVISQESALTPMSMMASVLAYSPGTHLVEIMLPTAKTHISEIAHINPLAAYLYRNSNYRNTRLFASAISPCTSQREQIIDQLVKSIIDFMEPNQIAIVFLGIDDVLICANTAHVPIAMATYGWTNKERRNVYTIIPDRLRPILEGLEWSGEVTDDVITFILGKGNMRVNNLDNRVAKLLHAEREGL